MGLDRFGEASQHWVLRRVVEALDAFRKGEITVQAAVSEIAITESIVESDVPKDIRLELVGVYCLREELAEKVTTEEEAIERLNRLEGLLAGFKRQPLYPPTIETGE